MVASKFFYFGFGSNMLAKRIHIQNPTAIRVGPGKLQDYRLDFYTSSKAWLGAPATIVPTQGSNVYGTIWEIDIINMKDLDNQESVHQGVYVPITVSVWCTTTSKIIECRAYHLTKQPSQDLKDIKDIPYDRQPSKTYLKTLIKGAQETGIIQDYIKWLYTIKHNHKTVDEMEKYLELEDVIVVDS